MGARPFLLGSLEDTVMWHSHTKKAFFRLKNGNFYSALFWLRCNPLVLKPGHSPFFS